jgi:DNA-3-methyladenine glycosylase I
MCAPSIAATGVLNMKNSSIRCSWVSDNPLYVDYHDKEWGVPVHDDAKLFEFLILEGAQAGLSWLTILKRRKGYQKAFHNFDVARVAAMTDAELEAQLQNPGIIRNRLKVYGARKNAQAFLNIQAECGSFDAYVWKFVNGQPIVNRWASLSDVPVVTDEATALSKDLKKRGFTFVGPTICYAYMQAMGLAIDHERVCDAP